MIQYKSPCGHGAYTLFGRERNAKKKRNLIVKIHKQQQTVLFPRIPGIFFQKPDDKKRKKKNRGGKKLLPLYPVYIRITSTLWTTTNKLEAGPAANKRPRQRETDASHTRVLLRSCRDVRRPRHQPNENTAAIFQMGIVQMGPRKNKYRISEIPRQGEVY